MYTYTVFLVLAAIFCSCDGTNTTDGIPNSLESRLRLLQKSIAELLKRQNAISTDITDAQSAIKSMITEGKSSTKTDVQHVKEILTGAITNGQNAIKEMVRDGQNGIKQMITQGKDEIRQMISSSVGNGGSSLTVLTEAQSAIKRMVTESKNAIKVDIHNVKEILSGDVIRFPNPVFSDPDSKKFYVQGHVEILHDDTWGTICDDGFDSSVAYGDAGANVLCRMEGYESGVYDQGAYKQPSATKTSKIWLDDVQCNGKEKDVDDCSRSAWGTHNCNHGEDVGIRCYF